MHKASFRFYASLNDFLPRDRRQVTFVHAFQGRESVKDLIEAIGVPHTEVDVILIQGKPADFSSLVEEGDRISVYPAFESIEIAPLTRVGPEPFDDARFVLDTHLGRLAAYLRLAGFDALYRNDFGDDTLAHVSRREDRILLTRDLGLLKRRAVTRGYWLRTTAPRRQLVEVLQRFDLLQRARPFRRCLRCNALLEPATKESVIGQLPPRTRQHYHEFHRCTGCDRVYWKGSHYEAMESFLSHALSDKIDARSTEV